MSNFLDKILDLKKLEVASLMKAKPLNTVYEDIKNNVVKKIDFKKAIVSRDINIIAEIKKASPSKGDFMIDMDVSHYASLYEKAGASAISVLTEKNFFKGSIDDLICVKQTVDIPVLRKDFIIDSYQIFEAKFIGADAVLLIADILDEKVLSEFIVVCKYLQLDALVEVHEEESLVKAINAGAEIIGINNRCLKSFQVDINTTKTLLNIIPDDKVIISESGIFTIEDIRFLLNDKLKTFLIGEAIVNSLDVVQKIHSLMGI